MIGYALIGFAALLSAYLIFNALMARCSRVGRLAARIRATSDTTRDWHSLKRWARLRESARWRVTRLLFISPRWASATETRQFKSTPMKSSERPGKGRWFRC